MNQFSEGACAGTGGRLVTVMTQVRFLPSELGTRPETDVLDLKRSMPCLRNNADRFLDCLCGSEPNGEEAVSKTAAACPLQVRVLSLPLSLTEIGWALPLMNELFRC